MTSSAAFAIQTTCSGCSADVELVNGSAVVAVPSNGKRGSLHVPAHKVEAPLSFTEDDSLLLWDCPVPSCGYADSYDLTA